MCSKTNIGKARLGKTNFVKSKEAASGVALWTLIFFVSTSNSLAAGSFAQESAAQAQPSNAKENEVAPKLLLKPGQPIVTGMQTEDIVVTEDVNLAREQVAAYPDSPEASFILAVALTRTSMVEEALKEVRRARKLADKQGGPAYFDHMIAMYEQMLQSYPEDNRVRYGLAWAYYMKAYVLGRYCKKQDCKKQDGHDAKAQKKTAPLPVTTLTPVPVPATPASSTATQSTPAQPPAEQQAKVDSAASPTAQSGQTPNIANTPWQNKWVPSLLSEDGNEPDSQVLRASQSANASGATLHIPSALDQVIPEAVPQVRKYYQAALKNLDDLLAKNPNDVWAQVYRAFLNAEYTGNLGDSMNVWRKCRDTYPDNPAPYFFLGEGYLKEGNLKECLQNVSKAIFLRSLGK
jgi:tetratricopeptide (TPR) repeat protein